MRLLSWALILQAGWLLPGCSDAADDPCLGVDGGECTLASQCQEGRACWCGLCAPNDCAGVIEIRDSVLEDCVRFAADIDKDMPIRYDLVRNIRKIHYEGRQEEDLNIDIWTLDGIQCLVSLEALEVPKNYICDFEPLVGLGHLVKLDVSDNLFGVSCDFASIGKLVTLEDLHLYGRDAIADIGPLNTLVHLKRLDVAGNDIEDISAISGMTDLSYLDISSNRVQDLGPLVANTGIGQGDELVLFPNGIDCDEQADNLQALHDRGVVFDDWCQ